jgi:hypothetical protein
MRRNNKYIRALLTDILKHGQSVNARDIVLTPESAMKNLRFSLRGPIWL